MHRYQFNLTIHKHTFYYDRDMFTDLVEERLGWDASALDAEFRDLELQLRALEARRAANLIAAEARQVADLDGHRSTRAYVRGSLNAPAGEAGRMVRRARFLREHPEVGDALAAGRVGVAQVDLLVRVANHRRVGVLFDDAVIAMFVEHAEHFSFADLETLVGRWVALADEDGAWRDHLDSLDARTAHVRIVGGEADLTAAGGDALTAERLRLIMDRFVEAEFQRDAAERRARYGDHADAHPLARSDAQRRFDALVAIFDTANAHGDAPGKPVDATVDVLIDARTLHAALASEGVVLPNGDVFDPGDLTRDEYQVLLAELLGDPQLLLRRRCETASGQPVHPRLVARALLTGYVRRVVLDSEGVPISFGRSQRCFTGPARVAARLQNRVCEHPGCGLPAHLCDTDHIAPFSEGGRTDQANAAIECNPHNRIKQRRRWRTRRGANRKLYTYRPDGTLMLAVGERPPDPTDEQQAAATRARLDSIIALRQPPERGT